MLSETDPPIYTPQLDIGDHTMRDEIYGITSGFHLKTSALGKLKNVFRDEIQLGLSLDPPKKSSCLCENTFVTRLPDGHQCGRFLALDLGSTNFRVIMMKLEPGRETEFIVEYYDVPSEIRSGVPCQHLFDFLAKCIYDFLVKKSELTGERIPLGFTFSFPMLQKAIDVGLLVTWTKCFDLPDCLGKNAAEYLQTSIDKINSLNVKVVAILNDTTGCIVRGVSMDRNCGVAFLLGTGFNAAYLEKVKNVHKWTDRGQVKDDDIVAINVECGGFGDNGVADFVKTEFDFQLDRNTLFPGSYTYEKLFSGKFIGEIVRLVLAKLVTQGLALGGKVTDKLNTLDSIEGSHVSNVESPENGTDNAVKMMENIGYERNQISPNDINIVKYICGLVSLRCARLVAPLIGTLLERVEGDQVTVAIDGSLYKHHPKMHGYLMQAIGEFSSGRKFKIILADDGSGKGAGLVAAVAAL